MTRGSPTLADGHHGPRYVGGALLCAAVNNLVLIGGNYAGLSDFTGVLLTWAIGGTTGYLWHYRVTFRAAASLAGYTQFMGGIVLAIPLTFAALALFHRLLGWPMWIAAPVATVLLVGYNYLNARLAIHSRLWRRKKDISTDGA